MIRWLFITLVAASACTSARTERLPRLEAASHEVKGILTAKGSLDQFRTAAATFSSELARANADVPSSTDRARLDRYGEIDKALQDIVAVWEFKQTRQQELVPLSLPLAERLAKEYQLPVNTNEPPSIYASEAMQTIWDATKQKMDALEGK